MEQEMTAVIVDDEVTARTTLSRMLAHYCPSVRIIGEAGDVVSGAKLIQRLQPGLVFLDIQLGSNSGFELLEVLGKPNFALIFVTAYDKFAVKAFKYNALDYLLKPIVPKELNAAIERVSKLYEDQKLVERLSLLKENFQQDVPNTLVVTNDEGYFFLNLNEVIRLESKGNGVTAFYSSNRPVILTTKNIGEFDDLLPHFTFFRVHQSHIINLQWVDSYRFEDGGIVVIKGGEQIPLARRRRDEFLKIIRRYKQV